METSKTSYLLCAGEYNTAVADAHSWLGPINPGFSSHSSPAQSAGVSTAVSKTRAARLHTGSLHSVPPPAQLVSVLCAVITRCWRYSDLMSKRWGDAVLCQEQKRMLVLQVSLLRAV